jgi:hypothetical protein
MCDASILSIQEPLIYHIELHLRSIKQASGQTAYAPGSWIGGRPREALCGMDEKKDGVTNLFTYDSLYLYAILWRNGHQLLWCHGYDLNQKCLSGNDVRGG